MNDLKKRTSEDGRLVKESADLPIFSSFEKERESKKNTFWFIAAMLVMTVLLMGAIAAGVELNEITVRNSDLKAEIKTLEKQKGEYEAELEKKNDMVAFEQHALNELGMLKGQEIQTDDREDKIE